MMVFPDFEAGHVVYREAVVTALRCFHLEDRKTRRLEIFRPARLSPQQYLTLRDDKLCETGDDPWRPRSGGQYQGTCLVARTVGVHHDSTGIRLPPKHAFATVNFSPVRKCRIDMCRHAPFRHQETTVWLVYGHHVRR